MQATKILENMLKLSVDQSKSDIAHSNEGVKFLGVEIGSKHTRIQAKKLAGFKSKLKQMTKRNSGRPLCAISKALNPTLRGFSQYFVTLRQDSVTYSDICESPGWGWL